MRPILAQRAGTATVSELPPPGAGGPDTAAPGGLIGEIAEGDLPLGNMAVVSDFNLGDMQMPMAMNNGFGDEAENADPVTRLKRLIEERQAESVEILRSWMDEAEERA